MVCLDHHKLLHSAFLFCSVTTYTAFQYVLVSIIFTLVCPLPNIVMNQWDLASFMGCSWVSIYVHRCKWLNLLLSFFEKCKGPPTPLAPFPLSAMVRFTQAICLCCTNNPFFMYTNWLGYVLPFSWKRGVYELIDQGQIQGGWPPHDHSIEDYIITN